MKRTIISALGAAGLIGLGMGAIATAEGHNGMHGKHAEKRAEMIQKFDADFDGKLSETERDAMRLAKFAEMDTDGNGSLTQSELTNFQIAKVTERVAKHFAEEDVNGDGVISADEFGSRRKAHRESRREKHEARRAEMLEKFDADGDGKLNETERDAARAAGFGRRGGPR